MPRIDLPALLTQPVEDPPQIVHGMLARGNIALLIGEPGIGKSFLSYYLCFCVALGRPFLGLQTSPTTIVYFDQENPTHDHARYLQWVWRGLGEPDPIPIAERVKVEHFSLREGWKTTLTRCAREDRPGLIVLDTLTPTLHIEDENDNGEAYRAFKFLQDVQAVSNNDTAILILAHQKHRTDVNDPLTNRGAKAWLGAVSNVMFHMRGPALEDTPLTRGLKATFLSPYKTRAFGLRGKLTIKPHWTQPEEPRGIMLDRK